MEDIFAHIAARERLIVREHYRVVFGVRLVTSLTQPALVTR